MIECNQWIVLFKVGIFMLVKNPRWPILSDIGQYGLKKSISLNHLTENLEIHPLSNFYEMSNKF